MLNKKAKGSRTERMVKKELEKQGCICIKSAGSLGIWDIIAIGSFVVRLIQVKSIMRETNFWRCWKKDKEKMEMIQERLPVCCRQEMWIIENNKKRKIYWWDKIKWRIARQ